MMGICDPGGVEWDWGRIRGRKPTAIQVWPRCGHQIENMPDGPRRRIDRNSVRSDIFVGLNANAISSPVGAAYSALSELG